MAGTAPNGKGAVPEMSLQEKFHVEKSGNSAGSASSKAVYDGEGDVIPLYKGKEFLLYFDFIFRFWIYWDTIPHAVAYFSAFGFFVGGMLFVIGTFSGLSPAVQALAVPLSCGHDAYSWWTAFPYLLGDIIWQIACTLQVLESLNGDYEDRLDAWEANRKEGPRPRYRWIGIKLTSWEFWGAFSYDFGVLLYLIAEILTYATFCPGTQLSNNVVTICINYFYLVAGILFFLAGVFYIVPLGSPWVLPNIFVPLTREAWVSMMWWALWFYFWGGVCFCMSGIFLYWYSPDNLVLNAQAYQIENAIGFGGGAFLFFVGALILLMRQSRGRCRPSFRALNTNNDPSFHAGTYYKKMQKTPEMV